MSSEGPLETAAIIAGGLATRMRPLTEKIPKSLIEVDGEPFVFHQLRLLHDNSIKKAVLCVGYLGEEVEKAVGDGAKLGIRVEYSYDGDALVGTGGALRRALAKLDDTFFIVYGDSYLDCDYQGIWGALGSSLGLMTVFRNDGRWGQSNVEFNGKDIIAYDKSRITPSMRHIDYGLGILRREALLEVEEGQYCDLVLVYQELLRRKQLAAFEVKERFYEIGSPEGLAEAREYIARRRR